MSFKGSVFLTQKLTFTLFRTSQLNGRVQNGMLYQYDYTEEQVPIEFIHHTCIHLLKTHIFTHYTFLLTNLTYFFSSWPYLPLVCGSDKAHRGSSEGVSANQIRLPTRRHWRVAQLHTHSWRTGNLRGPGMCSSCVEYIRTQKYLRCCVVCAAPRCK